MGEREEVSEPERMRASREARAHIDRFNHFVDFMKNLAIVGGMVLAVFVFFWNAVGKPYAQNFVNATVDERLDEVEEKQQELINQTQELSNQLQILQSTAEGTQDVQAEILRLLRLGLTPATVIAPMPNPLPETPPTTGP